MKPSKRQRKAWRAAPHPPSILPPPSQTIPPHFRLDARPDARPHAEERLALIREYDAEIRHVYERFITATDPAEGRVVVVAAMADALGAALVKGASPPSDWAGDVAIVNAPRRTVALFVATADPVACYQLETAPRGVLVVVVLAFGGVKVWYLPGQQSEPSGWAQALLTYKNTRPEGAA